MRGVCVDPIDAAKHRSSSSRVPGLRAGHSFMWSQPLFPDLAGMLPVTSILRNFGRVRKRWRFVLSRINAENRSCYRGSMRSGFVLSRINESAGFVLSRINALI